MASRVGFVTFNPLKWNLIIHPWVKVRMSFLFNQGRVVFFWTDRVCFYVDIIFCQYHIIMFFGLWCIEFVLYLSLLSFTLIRSSNFLMSRMDCGGLNLLEPLNPPLSFLGVSITIPPYKDSYVRRKTKITFSTRRRRRFFPRRFQYL